MHDPASAALTPWSNFYVITGSSSAALTGLMFVVITLIADGRGRRSGEEGTSTFSTPTVVHFCVVLFVSTVLSAPWHTLVPAATLLALTGLFGVAYVSRNIVRMMRLSVYRPGLDDWVWYNVLPLVAYLAIAVAGAAMPFAPKQALFAVAGSNVLLIFIGIHNAWDVVLYIAVHLPPEPTNTP